MLIKMTLDLTLGLGHEPETDTITQERCGRADDKRAGVPQWIEQAGARAKLLEACLAPGKMVGLAMRCSEQQLARCRGVGARRLPVIERLGCELTGVIDAHQRRAGAPFLLGQRLGSRAGRGTTGVRRREYRPQGAINSRDGRVEMATRLHKRGRIIGAICGYTPFYGGARRRSRA